MNGQIIKIKYFSPMTSGELGWSILDGAGKFNVLGGGGAGLIADAKKANAAAKKTSAKKTTVKEPKIYTIAGTLGDNLGTYGTGVNASVIQSDVLKQFKELGWNVQSFDFDWYRDEKQYRFRMTALVPASYTLEQVKLIATEAFQNFNGGWLGHFFTNVRLDAAAQYVAPVTSSNTNNSDGGKPPDEPFSLGTILTGLFGTAGLSIGLVTVVLVGIVIFKG